MKNRTVIFSFFLALFMVTSIFCPVYAQDTASLLPQAVQQFFDNNGNSLSSGKVYFYEVGTTTFKNTYTAADALTINQNPITLNAGGKAPTGGIYGIGLYRQIVKDRNGNLIWDAVTEPGGGGSSPTNVGDGNLVGTVLPWSGLVAPNQYVFGYGQEINRATFTQFFTAITQQLNVICSSSSNTLTGVGDTTQIKVGSAVELSLCVVPGTTVTAKTGSTVVLSNPSSVSINAVATFFPYGNGNGSTTFNVPDFRGYAVAGRDNMGGTAAGRLSAPTFAVPGLGATGGSQTTIVQIPQILAAVGPISANSQANVTIPTVQPTITINYIVKITPDVSGSVATGVASLGGMTGVISCGTGLLCTGNIVAVQGISQSTLNTVSTGWGLTGGPCTVTCTVSTAVINPAMGYGLPINVGITASVASNALTIALKANDGTDPTSVNPILIPFRSSTVSIGSPTWISLNTALSTTIISGATLGTANAIPFRYWIAAVNNNGTPALCLINTLSGTNIYALASNDIITGTTPAANTAQTWYCNVNITNKAYTLLGYLTYESGLTAAGVYTAIPNVIQMYGPGVPLPGTPIQSFFTSTGSLLTSINTYTFSDTAPVPANGLNILSQDITPKSGANILTLDGQTIVGNSADNIEFVSYLTQDASTSSLTVSSTARNTVSSNVPSNVKIYWQKLTGIISLSTYKLFTIGDGSTTNINGAGGARRFGGFANTYLKIQEIQR